MLAAGGSQSSLLCQILNEWFNFKWWILFISFFCSWQPTYWNSLSFFFFCQLCVLFENRASSYWNSQSFPRSSIFSAFPSPALAICEKQVHLLDENVCIRPSKNLDGHAFLSHFNKDDYMNIQVFWSAAFWKTVKCHFRIFESFLVAAKPDK